ncbi:DUF3604 domain-containing protein [Ramlibacter rhizophilus]|uniref:DUF3604 domain-containing protein n=1 Tax=Ramlibacter rhizophilus TaxID=1781167 RepID=A0A4Z0BZX6_9BURK|nr:DUF3604 domain-containing protein [Ramlibacter rhizophilus]TFZ04813.1 DUF3604 domain-containing protein [Ramlibacter rhizophilus]
MRNNAFHSTYLADRAGHASITPATPVEAGAFASWTLTYTAGYFGIDDTGSLKIVHRFASDMGKPQFTDPKGWNYVSAEASNGAVLELRYDQKGNVRPWDKTISIRVQRGFLREGDTITVRLGDTRGGSPGMRVQTFSEPTFEFRVLVDAFATYNFVELPEQPTVPVVAGPPVLFKAILPTQRRVGQAFALGFKGEDRWGNPSHRVSGRFTLEPSVPVENLPPHVDVVEGALATRIDSLRVAEPGELVVTVRDAQGQLVCTSNPLRIATHVELLPFWADLHGQSEETIGTNSARELIEFARDTAFLDAMSHQGNDFQITTPFWEQLNALTREYNRDGSFIIFPGYEWSGNTGLGGDRNVMFKHEGRTIHRSHHALVEDLSDVATDANSAADLFRALEGEDCVVFAHIGGRYADIRQAHDARIERSIEIHSDWGTFEWLLEDAFDQGFRVGILANSDGHKGRHGASHPGASLFGAYGGLSCLLARELTRDALFEALRRRHHYATTGCRAHLDLRLRFDTPASLYSDDPALGGKVAGQVSEARMGDILRCADEAVTLEVDLSAGAPIERIEIRNRMQVLETWRPFDEAALGRRIRIVWEGSEYRGRGRQSVWDGSATLEDNRIERATPINLWNIDKPLRQTAPGRLEWAALTTGGFGGADLLLADAQAGTLVLDTALVKAQIPLAHIGADDLVLETGGGIQRRMRVFRLPEDNTTRTASIRRRIPRSAAEDALYVCVTLEDGHRLWSSPIYLLR